MKWKCDACDDPGGPCIFDGGRTLMDATGGCPLNYLNTPIWEKFGIPDMPNPPEPPPEGIFTSGDFEPVHVRAIDKNGVAKMITLYGVAEEESGEPRALVTADECLRVIAAYQKEYAAQIDAWVEQDPDLDLTPKDALLASLYKAATTAAKNLQIQLQLSVAMVKDEETFPKFSPVCEQCNRYATAVKAQCCKRGVAMKFKRCFEDPPGEQQRLKM